MDQTSIISELITQYNYRQQMQLHYTEKGGATHEWQIEKEYYHELICVASENMNTTNEGR